MNLTNEVFSLANPTNLLTKIGGIGGGMLAFGGLVKMVTVVNQGEAGIRTHLGNPYYKHGRRKGELIGVLQKGTYWHAPAVHSIKKISIQNRALDLKPITTSSRNAQRFVQASVVWRVSKRGDNPVRAFYAPDGGTAVTLPDIISNICGSALREIIDDIPADDSVRSQGVERDLRRQCRKDLGHYGVQLVGVTMNSAGETLGEMLRSAGGITPGLIGALATGESVTPGLRIVTPPTSLG